MKKQLPSIFHGKRYHLEFENDYFAERKLRNDFDLKIISNYQLVRATVFMRSFLIMSGQITFHHYASDDLIKMLTFSLWR